MRKEIKNIWLVLEPKKALSDSTIVYAVCATRKQAREAKAEILLEKHVDDLYRLVKTDYWQPSDIERLTVGKDDLSIYKISCKSLYVLGLLF